MVVGRPITQEVESVSNRHLLILQGALPHQLVGKRSLRSPNLALPGIESLRRSVSPVRGHLENRNDTGDQVHRRRVSLAIHLNLDIVSINGRMNPHPGEVISQALQRPRQGARQGVLRNARERAALDEAIGSEPGISKTGLGACTFCRDLPHTTFSKV